MLSKSQIITLQGTLWPEAAKAQQWPRNDRQAMALGWESERAFKLHVLGEILGRTLESSKDIGKVDEFTRVKNRLERLADNLRGAAEDGDRVPNELRTRRWVALNDIKCLLLYVEDGYVREILRERFGRAGICHTTFGELPFEDILAEFKDVGVLDELLYTLGQRLHAKERKGRMAGYRVQAGHTLHEMRTLAGVKCDCKACAGARVTLPATQPEPDLEAVGAEKEPF